MFVALGLSAALAACGPPEDARIAATARAESLPAPSLEPTSAFDAARESAGPVVDENIAEAGALEARAQALRARAETLSREPLAPQEP